MICMAFTKTFSRREAGPGVIPWAHATEMNQLCGLRSEISSGLGTEMSEVDRSGGFDGALSRCFAKLRRTFGFELVELKWRRSTCWSF